MQDLGTVLLQGLASQLEGRQIPPRGWSGLCLDGLAAGRTGRMLRLFASGPTDL